MSNAQRFRELLSSRTCAIAPGCYDAISARIVEDAGFPIAYMSGLCVAASMGYPDVGLISWTDMVRRAELIANTISIPLFVDADSGNGGPANLAEAVRAYERAGAAGLHLEDQPFPKKCAALPGKSLITPELACANIRIALDARRDPAFVIVARTDAMLVSGLDDAIARAVRYERAGADATLVMSVGHEAEMRAVQAALEKPTLAMMLEHKRALTGVRRLEQLGYPLVVYPCSLLQGQVKVQQTIAARLRDDGSTAGVLDAMTSIDEINAVMDLDEVNAAGIQSAAYQASASVDRRSG